MQGKEDYIKWFSEIDSKNSLLVGEKAAKIAEVANVKLPVPTGFVITSEAFNYFLDSSGIRKKIDDILKEVKYEDDESLERSCAEIKELILNADIPKNLKTDINEAYDVLDVDRKSLNTASSGALDILRTSHEPPFVSVRGSPTSNKGDASFAGQHEFFLNVKGDQELIRKVKECFASEFSPNVLRYKRRKGVDLNEGFSIIVQEMADVQKSGVMFTKNPMNSRGQILVEAVWGLGLGLSESAVTPDSYILDDHLEIIDSQVSKKRGAIVRDSAGRIGMVKLSEEREKQQVLSNHEIKKLAQYALQLEQHFKKPQDVEFVVNSEGIFILQSRDITTKPSVFDEEVSGNVLLSGIGVSQGFGSGNVRMISSDEDLNKVQKGDVIVSERISPKLLSKMHKASAMITKEGGIGSSTSVFAREIELPMVSGGFDSESKIRDGQLVSVDAFTGKVIEGKGFEKKLEINPVVPTRSKIRLSVDVPEYAEAASSSRVDSVGLVRFECLVSNLGKHSNWYLKNNELKSYIDGLHSASKKIAYPFKEVWFKISDTRSDEYVNLPGAEENIEGNPLLGNHGIRFSLRNLDLFESELNALKDLADDFPDKSLGMFLPNVVSVEEIREAKKVIGKVGLPENVKLGVMVETPASVQIIEDICQEKVEAVCIGMDNLTQLTLAVDRNNPDVRELYNEMSPAVLNSVRYVIRKCNKYGIQSSVSGRAANNPAFARLVVREGIGGLTVNPDSAEGISKVVADVESQSKEKPKMEETRRETPNYGVGMVDEGMFSPEPILRQAVAQNIALAEQQTPKLPQPQMAGEKKEEPENEEDLILKALDSEEESNEYLPGFNEKKSDVPVLNEAIPVESSHIEDQEKENREEEHFMDFDEYSPAEDVKSEESNEPSAEDENSVEEVLDDEIPDEMQEDKVLDIF